MIIATAAFPLYPQSQGKIITVQGKVEYLPVKIKSWEKAKILQKLYEKDRVKTFKRSRAAILLRDETQLRLNSNAELVIKQLKKKSNKSSILELVKGEGWFRTKNPNSKLEVHTPTVTAAVRGSEINLQLGKDGRTIMTVLEGNIAFYNKYGSIVVMPGEEATVLPGKAPVKRKILNPDDAVQWVLYYPVYISWYDLLQELKFAAGSGAADISALKDAFIRCKKGDLVAAINILKDIFKYKDGNRWAAAGLASAYIEQGRADLAVSVLDKGEWDNLEYKRLSLLAGARLLLGEAQEAKKLLEQSLSLKDNSPFALTLFSTMELIQNHKKKAQHYALRALVMHPKSESANITAGEIAQAFFNLERAELMYSAALEINPESVKARVSRARVLFGSGRAQEALRDIEYAEEIKPNDAQVLSLAGFIKLSNGQKRLARLSFEKAVKLDPQYGEPRLGLGLVDFREGRNGEGFNEILIATLIEPKVSLYQSYLAKAYHQLKRSVESIATASSAGKLDPKDPTPRLYESLFLQDRFRYVEALDKMQEAISLNDNRAVYRSRLLLDQDRATKSVSMAKIYKQLGFAPWGVYEALNSLASDFSSPGAHLFLADLYGEMPDRLQAQGSELLQYLLLIPVNRNVFSTYGEYTVLFDEPFFSLFLYGEASYPWYGLAETGMRSGSDIFAHLAFFDYKILKGARPGTPDQRYYGYINVKAALGRKTDILLTSYYTYTNYGSDEVDVITVGTDTAYPLNIQSFTDIRDANYSTQTNYFGVTVGFKHIFGIASPLTAVMQYELIRDVTKDPDAPSTISGILLNETIDSGWDMYDTQVQQILRLGNKNELISGTEVYFIHQTRKDKITAYDETTDAYITDWTSPYNSDNAGVALWVWDKWQILNWLHATLGFRIQKDVGKNILTNEHYDFPGIYPLLGLSFNIGGNSVIRTALFQRRNTRLFGDKISPTTVEGFLLERNEPEQVLRTEFGLSWEKLWKRLFLSTGFFYRHNEYPPGGIIAYDHSEHFGLNSYLNWIITRFFCLSLENQALLISTVPFNEIDNSFKAGAALTFPFGLTFYLTDTVLFQHYLRASAKELTGSLFNLLDAKIQYIFPGKKGSVNIIATNILNQAFEYFIDALSLSPLHPYRRVEVNLSIQF